MQYINLEYKGHNVAITWRPSRKQGGNFNRKKLTYNENKSVIIYVKNNLQYSDHVFRTPFSDTWMR